MSGTSTVSRFCRCSHSPHAQRRFWKVWYSRTVNDVISYANFVHFPHVFRCSNYDASVRIADLCAKIVSACSPSSKDQVHPIAFLPNAVVTDDFGWLGHHHGLNAPANASGAPGKACTTVVALRVAISAQSRSTLQMVSVQGSQISLHALVVV